MFFRFRRGVLQRIPHAFKELRGHRFFFTNCARNPRRCQIHIPFRRLPRLLLESVKHVNRIRECGDIDYPEGAGTLANPDLANGAG
jgi:hypothetical protein